MHLRNIFVTLNILDLTKPEIYGTFAGDKFDASGHLVDEEIRQPIEAHLEAFVHWVDLVGK